MLVYRVLKDGKWWKDKFYYKISPAKNVCHNIWEVYDDKAVCEIQAVDLPDWESLPWLKIEWDGKKKC